MPVSDLENIITSIDLTQSNYDAVNEQFLDASIFGKNLVLKDGTPSWATIGGNEGLLLDNQFYFEYESFPAIPKGSFIVAANTNSTGGDGVLSFLRWFKGQEVPGDHAVNDYDPSIDPTATSIRDQSIEAFNNTVRIFDGQGLNAAESTVADDWYIATAVVELLPAKLRISINNQTFVEASGTQPYLLATFGNILRLGYLNSSYPLDLSPSTIYLGEVHFFQGDVSQQDGYSDVIDELITKYGITP